MTSSSARQPVSKKLGLGHHDHDIVSDPDQVATINLSVSAGEIRIWHFDKIRVVTEEVVTCRVASSTLVHNLIHVCVLEV